MGLKFWKKLFGTEEKISKPKDITEELKNILHNKWKEQEKTELIPFDEMYVQMVKEAVLVIQKSWRRKAEYNTNFMYPVDEVEITAFDAFFVTEDLKLYSDSLYRPINPETGCDCFYSHFTFPDVALVDQYIEDILECLPAGTSFEKYETTRPTFGHVTVYAFTIKLTNLRNQ